MIRPGRKPASILLIAALLMMCAACGSSGQTQPSPSASETKMSASQEPSSSSSETSSAQNSPSPSKEPEATAEPSSSDDHGHDQGHDDGKASPMPSKDDGKSSGKSSAAPSPTPGKKPSPAPSPSKEPEKNGATVTVEIKDYAFNPSDITIQPGDKVTFTNRDPVSHTATSEDGSFDTGLISQDKSKTVVFDKEGTFSYYCDPHPSMTATITVKKKS